MKIFIPLFLIALGSFVSAAQGGNNVGGGAMGGGGGGDRGRKIPVVALSCEEGSRAMFSEIQSNGRYIDVWRTCQDGRFYPKTAPVNPLRCRDGATAGFPQLLSNGRYTLVPHICVNGKFVPN